MTENEENFPRGKINSSSSNNKLPSILKKTVSNNTKKRKRSESLDNTDDVNNGSELFTTEADGLTYKKVQEQMLLLGCIRGISPFALDMELPGKVCGKIKINAISQTFLNVLREEYNRKDQEEEKDLARLNTMFRIGQYVPIKVIEKIENFDKTTFTLSLDPAHINSDWNHGIFKKGLLVWAAVASELDHGYQLDAGIHNTHIFLPFENIEEDTTIVIGQPLWSVVQTCEVTSTAAIIHTSILKKSLENAMQNDMNLHCVVPGMQFNFTVSKIVKYGLQGKFMGQCVGYINESYLATPLEKLSKYKKEQTVKASLLYIEPTTKFGYFTRKNIYSFPNLKYGKGDILRAQIISKTGGGLAIKLPNKSIAFVSNKRLSKMLPKNNNLSETITKRFRPDSYHQCRILNYNCMEDIYIATFEPLILNEKYFTESDVKIGELITVTVTAITKEGLQVSFGKLQGFIYNIHLSNSKYSENIKKRFSQGKTLQARVLTIDDRGIYFTHKQALVNSDLCLSSYNDAVINQQYPGVVVNKSAKGVLVVFYGDVRGMLFRKYLIKMYPDYNDDLYYEGQVVMTTVNKVIDGNFLELTLNASNKPLPAAHSKLHLQVGEYFKAVITGINNKNGLEVEVMPHKIKASIPAAHLSTSLKLTPLLLETYKIGETLNKLLCVNNNKNNPILSIREEEPNPDLKNIQPGSLIRCSYENSDKSGVFVSAPFAFKNLKIKIPYEQFLDKGYDKKLLKLQPQQAIIIKVLELDQKHNNKIRATAKLSEVFDGNYMNSLNLLEQHLRDIEQIRKYLLSKGSNLAKLKLGQRVECEVKKVTATNGCKVVLVKNKINGFVSTNHHSKNIKTGQKLTGVILYVNYVEEYVEISFNKNVMEKVNEIQDGVIHKTVGSSCNAELLINHPDYVIAVLKNQDTNGQLIFLPSKFHENAFMAQIQAVEELSKIKVLIHNKINNKLIVGLDKGLIHTLKKAQATTKRKRNNNNKAESVNKKPRLDIKNIPNGNKYNNQEEQEGSEEDLDDVPSPNEEEEEEDVDSEPELEEEEENEDKDPEEEIEAKDECYEEEEEQDVDSEPEWEEENEDKGPEEVYTNEDDCSEEENDIDEEEDVDSKPEWEEEEVSVDEDPEEEEIEAKDEEDSEEENDIEEDSASEEEKKIIIKNGSKKLTPALPGVDNFFNDTTENNGNNEDESSSDEDISEIKTKEKPKKKLTPAERKELARIEEEKLLKKEIENADLATEPQTVEQFQKLVKGKPNCSKSWIKFISHLLSNAEIEKAKAVAQEALKTIDMSLTNERFNIWIARINLENDYGDKNSFDEVFNEAVRCNDSLKVYLAVMKILAEAQKTKELQQIIQKAKNKFGRESLEMWLEIGQIYYKNGQIKEARNAKDAGLLKLRLKSSQIALVIRFALMEFQYGEKNQGEALFETLLQHNPKRVDIWTTYVDQVIKKNHFDAARRILERAVSQSIPLKKKRILFKKYKDFESAHGNKEQVEHVIELAKKCAAGVE